MGVSLNLCASDKVEKVFAGDVRRREETGCLFMTRGKTKTDRGAVLGNRGEEIVFALHV